MVRQWKLPWCINTGKSLIPLTLLFLHQKRNLLIPLELSRVMHQGTDLPGLCLHDFVVCSRSALGTAANTDSKLLIYGLFQKG